MPVLASNGRRKSGLSFDYKERSFDPNVLRYYGNASDVGLTGSYDINKNNSLDFKFDRYTEDLVRDVKHSDSDLEPQQHFKRNADRNTFNLAWKGRRGNTDWTVEGNYTRMKEDDVALINYFGRSAYEGKNELRYVDDVDHRQYNLQTSFNTQINDRHMLNYGIGYSHEEGEGSRLKSSPHTRTKYIDAWDYDKNLLVDKLDRLVRKKGDTSTRIYSHIHDYKFDGNDASGMPQWDINYEYYGEEKGNAKTIAPIKYEDYENYKLGDKGMREEKTDWSTGKTSWVIKTEYDGTVHMPNGAVVAADSDIAKRYEAMYHKLTKENPGYKGGNIVGAYFEYGESSDAKKRAEAPTLNGKKFLEEFRNRNQRITVGSGKITKHNVFLSDMWQVNPDTIIVPTLRYDHSNLFGSNLSGNLGLTYTVAGNAHRRFKANIGTGYTEPGMGELWYNWEMYASNPVGVGYAKLGWYWAGNPNLKPEKSLNFDMSVEGENKNTYARLGIFHNRIKNYMSVYYTGALMDFAPYLHGDRKYQRAPDMIYSFKNIGRAEITGLEAEVRQKLGNHWSAKLGYTYLHAINKSDPQMPHRLLDKPMHKVDIGLTFDDPVSGWGASIWGDYYIRMLDSNTLADSANYWPDILDGEGAVYNKRVYQEKTFGIWNLLFQKKFDEDSIAYFGVNNVFNHRDDDRATQERVYRFGVNLKLGFSRKAKERVFVPKDKAGKANVAPVLLQGFLDRPFDTEKERGAELMGEYRARWKVHDGTNRPQSRYRADTYVGTAAANMKDQGEHGFEQRVRLGVDARLSENTNLTVVGSASGESGVDTSYETESAKGIKHRRLDRVDLTQRAHKWDFSIGRLTEPMGVTGYWFGKEFDGARAVWTGKETQIRLGYGTFTHSTGIPDSAYTHAVHATFFRPPTIMELVGIDKDEMPYAVQKGTTLDKTYETAYKGKTDSLFFLQQLRDVCEDPKATEADKLAVLQRMQRIVKQAYGEDLSQQSFALRTPASGYVLYKIRNKKTHEEKLQKVDLYYSNRIDAWDSDEIKALKKEVNKDVSITLSNENALRGRNYIEANKDTLLAAYSKIAKVYATSNWNGKTDDELGSSYTYVKYNGRDKAGVLYQSDASKREDYEFAGVDAIVTIDSYHSVPGYDSSNVITPIDLLDGLYKANYVDTNSDPQYGWAMPHLMFEFFNRMETVLEATESGNRLPRESIGKIVGNLIKTEGTMLERDRIPELDKAIFVQAKHEITPRLGVQAWYLRSIGDDIHTFLNANGKNNERHRFDSLANVIGIGAKYQIGANTSISFDYGQNRTDFGRYMNGRSMYRHERGTADFDLCGHENGGIPHFWTARLDIGQTDTNVAGSWNAFVDYKYFQHGSFFGGNGTEALPDRYLDGISSFTFGGGYVPAKNFLLEAFYTFDAKGINRRDTLYGPENFRLGNYTRLQMTYKF
nr:TonB-dependent receptor [uncultured Megasphaera sp.]